MRILFTVLFISSLLLTGCQNSQDQPQAISNQIARSWRPESATALSVATGQTQETYKRNPIDSLDIWINLAPDGTYTNTTNGKSDIGTWQLVDKQLTFTLKGSSPQTYEVQSVSATDLRLLLVVDANTQDNNQKAFLAFMQSAVGIDVSKGVKLTTHYIPR